jgi:phage protein D
MTTGGQAGALDARPRVWVDGREAPALSLGLLALSIVENTAGLYRCEAMFGNWGTVGGTQDYLYFDRRTLEFGKPFQVRSGDELLFDGRIMGMEAHFPPNDETPAITVLAEDRFQDLRMARRTRSFAEVSEADIFRQVAGDHGLQADVELPDTRHTHLAQVNQSDLAFLRERARAVEGELWVEGRTLRARRRAGRTASPVRLRYRGNLREFAVVADLAMQRTGVVVSGWDVAGKQAISHEATASLLAADLGTDVSGVSILEGALGARKESLAHTVPLTAAEAQAAAEGFFLMSARRFLVGRGVADPTAGLRVGATVELEQLGPLFSGRYYLTEVRHLFDAAGARSEFIGERAGIGRP